MADTNIKEKVIDARGKTLGRVSTEAAMALMGKDDPSYVPHIAGKTRVRIENASHVVLTEKRQKEKIYKRYSGHPGGQKLETMEEIIAKKGVAEVFIKAVEGMIPRNKLRKPRMKNLIVNE